MKKLQVASLICVLLTAGLAFSSCESLKKMVANHSTMAKYVATPNPLEMQGDKIKVEIKGNYQPKYFVTKAMVVFQPALNYEGGSILMKPMVLRGEKTKGQGTMIGSANGGSFTYTDEIDYQEGMEQSQLVLNPVAYMEKKAKNMQVTNEAEAAQVSGNVRLGETPVAQGTMITASRIDKFDVALAVEDHGYEKETVIPHDATIFFLVDMANLNWNLPLNKKAETKAGIKALDSLLQTGMQIKQVQINAWASPEGEESRNQNLSDNRVKTAEKYFMDTYNKFLNQRARAMKVKPNSLKQDIDMQTQSMGEDWEGFLADLRASSIADKNTIINVISSHTDKATREQEIRNMTVIYKEIEDDILPSLRRSEIHVDFLEPKRPDEQIAEYSLTAPDSLKLNELLYGAVLNDDPAQQLAIYMAAIRIYPDDYRAYVNLANILMKEEAKLAEAQSLLETANGMQPNNAHILNNMGALALAKGDFDNAKSLFESAAACAEAQENMGIIAIKEGRYGVAVSNLSARNCHCNLALAQLLNGDIEQAKATLNCMNPIDDDGLYLLAVCAARQDNKAEAIAALTKAFAENSSLKAQARKDIEFAKWAYETDFQNILR
ncbi:MAG: hypothetical protein K2G46_01320 [Bacteroidales bacterium]|nr:hypothetical protein [Bacteroidales bacterium]